MGNRKIYNLFSSYKQGLISDKELILCLFCKGGLNNTAKFYFRHMGMADFLKSFRGGVK